MTIFGKKFTVHHGLFAAATVVVACIVLALGLRDSQPIMRFIVPNGFRGMIQISRYHNGVAPTVTGNVTTFVIPSSGELEIIGALPYEQLSLTEALWADGEDIPIELEKAKQVIDRVYFWAAESDNYSIWCFVGTPSEYYGWLSQGVPKRKSAAK